MSVISVLNDEQSRKEAFARAGASDPALGSAERDWAENGWPQETLLSRFQEGARHGRGARGWNSAGPAGGGLLSLELPGATGFIQVALDPIKGEVAFKSAGMTFGPDSMEAAAEALARHSHQAGERVRASNPTELRKGLWQGEAPEELARMSSGLARFHPEPGADRALSWERDFESVHKACEDQRDPMGAMAMARAQYQGGSEKEMGQRLKEEIQAGANARVAGEPARLVALGARGAQLRAAIPLKEGGGIDEQKPIVALLGQEGEQGFKANGAPLRFYNMEAFERFASSAQSAELGVFPAPHLSQDALPRLEARRQALKGAQPSTAPGQGMRA